LIGLSYFMSPRTEPGLSGTKKLLVYLFGSLGDSIVAIPALRAVRRKFPAAEIVLLQNQGSGGVVLASQVIPAGLIDRYMSYDSKLAGAGRIGSFYRLWAELRRERLDAAAYLVISERPARAVRRDRLFFRSAGIPRLYGFHAIPQEELYPFSQDGRPLRSANEAEFKLKRLEQDGIETGEADLRPPLILASEADRETVGEWLAERRGRPQSVLVSIAPGCKTIANDWPIENFIELGRRLIDRGGVELIVTGGPAESGLGDELVAAWGLGINAAGVFAVPESAALLAACGLHIGLDTGTTHLAAAVGTRCFAIYGGRNNPGLWYPLGSGHTLVRHPVECSPCRLHECPVPGHPCMTGISIDAVWEHLQPMLDRGPDDGDPAIREIEVSARN